jgi:16S rRNA (cytidine1402-2'-O)-methyltransferase
MFDVVKDLEDGKIISLISESGLPLISDPGEKLLREVIKRKLKFTVIPGSTAVTTALVHSGFTTKNFLFLGFIPKKQVELEKLINKLISIKKIIGDVTFIAYESAHRLETTLKIMEQLIPDEEVCICREMTKKFEEIIRGKPSELIGKKYKGEITLVLKLP